MARDWRPSSWRQMPIRQVPEYLDPAALAAMEATLKPKVLETLDVIAETERLGFQGAWVPEHHLADDGYMPSPMIALAAMAKARPTMNATFCPLKAMPRTIATMASTITA